MIKPPRAAKLSNKSEQFAETGLECLYDADANVHYPSEQHIGRFLIH
jgi:hypothetical protein